MLLVFVPFANAQSDPELRKEIEDLKAQIKVLRTDVDDIKAIMRAPAPQRPEPVYDTEGDPSIGSPAAKLTLIEFSDFQCPFCLEYFKTVYRRLIDTYVKTGQVRYVFADYPGEKLHPQSFKAAQAGHCAADQGRFEAMHDQLFLHQRDFAGTGIEDAARDAALDSAKFAACMKTPTHDAAIRTSVDAVTKLGIQGTPAFGFGTPDPAHPTKIRLSKGLVGNQTWETFQKTIDALLAK